MRLPLAIVVSVLSIGTIPVSAQSTSWHGTVAGDVAVTDNVFAAPSGPSRDGDLFFQLRPGFLFARNAPRMIHDFTAEAEIIHYAFNSRIPSVTGRGGWRGFFLPGPRSEVITSLNAGSGILTALSSRLTADESMINVAPVGKVTFLQADASEYLSYVATRELRLSQGMFARWNKSNDNADDIDPMISPTTVESAEAGMTLGIERTFRNDALSIETGGSVQRLERIAPPTAAMGSRLDRQVNPRGRGQWRHDIDRKLSFNIDGGVQLVLPFGEDPYNPGETRKSGWFPILGGQFAVNEMWGRGTLSLRRDVAPNLFIAQNSVNTSAIIAAAVPLPWLDNTRRRAPKLVGLGSVSVQRVQLIDSVTSETESTIGAARLDVAVMYTPRPGVSYGARYELMYQTGDDRAAAMQIEGYYRNTIYFTYSIRYPDQVAGAVPKRRAGGASRADRKDLGAIGAEPVVPDLTEEEGEGDGDER